MNPAYSEYPKPGTLTSTCMDAVRVLVLKHVQGDTYVIFEDGGVYLSDGAGLKMLLHQLSGRSSQ